MYYSGDLSPDEQNMAMTSAGVADESDIWIYDFRQAISTRFTFDDAGEALPIYSPDGSLVAYSSNSGDTVGGAFTRLLLKESSGSRPESLLVDVGRGSVFACQFTADGRKLMYQRFSDGFPSLWLLDLETGEAESIFDTTTAVAWGKISPNSRWLAYGAVRDDVTEVYVTTFPKPSGKWQASAGQGGVPRWNGDGSELFYANDDDEICVVEITETARSLRIGKADTLFAVNPVNLSLVYTPFGDGQRFLTFENFATTSDNQIIFVQNYKQEFLERQ
jgi:Tol biopolymer transport system component